MTSKDPGPINRGSCVLGNGGVAFPTSPKKNLSQDLPRSLVSTLPFSTDLLTRLVSQPFVCGPRLHPDLAAFPEVAASWKDCHEEGVLVCQGRQT